MRPRKQATDGIVHVAKSLGPMLDQFVFVGGAVTGLIVTDPAAPEARFTEDVDIIIEMASLTEYYSLEEQLRSRGFVNSMEPGAPIGRWNIDGTTVDIMPTDISLLGFNTRWYSDAIEHCVNVEIETGITIRLISAPHFLATKIEAWKDRANGDHLHKDLEDIIAVIDGRTELLSEFAACSESVRTYTAGWFTEFLAHGGAVEVIEGHLVPQQSGRGRVAIVIQRMRALIATA